MRYQKVIHPTTALCCDCDAELGLFAMCSHQLIVLPLCLLAFFSALDLVSVDSAHSPEDSNPQEEKKSKTVFCF